MTTVNASQKSGVRPSGRTRGQDIVLSANIIFDTFDIMCLPIPVSRCNCLTPACLLSRAARVCVLVVALFMIMD